MRRIFHVRGSGSFPFEMLAIDKCYPAMGEGEKIELACPTVAPEQTIALITETPGGPTASLWKVKKWPVVYTS